MFLNNTYLQDRINSKIINKAHLTFMHHFVQQVETFWNKSFILCQKEVHSYQDEDTEAIRLTVSWWTRQLLRRETHCSATKKYARFHSCTVWGGQVGPKSNIPQTVLNQIPACTVLTKAEPCYWYWVMVSLILFILMVNLLAFISTETCKVLSHSSI